MTHFPEVITPLKRKQQLQITKRLLNGTHGSIKADDLECRWRWQSHTVLMGESTWTFCVDIPV